ncbi:2-amino-4-hydroxy-6-hydroxymethyldihydropteridine diphosphokinase [Methylomonas paludis]|uniref:2-amino-4-hydroxy-6-hydroxymethyldihydropteridine diphosphokinase n=1 Tax=Methylomonas paludis TaxID=1173101 RepID=A0A975MMC5_9GAMM|nr:2-amino-4-hydroxy-6-hydroxymethyldihydropteridine diphosphokinase [Methylomonas paludis]QWF70452.1 2-amino-4-hydroxy-6-hydroxymethyldihydropteridine diphosphokinase [Methylomonas paludis]
MTVGYISVGSNIDKDINIPSSLRSLRLLFGDIIISSIYETAAVGFVGDTFYNLIVRFVSELSAKQVAKALREIELTHGRNREAAKFSSRTLDLDLILYGEQVIRDGRLSIPRDEIERYAFVLEPLAEIAGNELHPISKKSFAELWQNFDQTDLQQRRVQPPWPSNE